MSATAESLDRPSDAAGSIQTVDVPTLCRVLDCGPGTIAHYAHAGVILKTGRGEYPLWDSIRRVIKYLRDQAANQGANDEIQQQRLEKIRQDNALKRMQLEREAGRLILLEDAVSAWSDLAAAARDELLAIPPRLKTELDALYGIDIDADLLVDPIERALRQLAEYVPQESPESVEPSATGAAAETADRADGLG